MVDEGWLVATKLILLVVGGIIPKRGGCFPSCIIFMERLLFIVLLPCFFVPFFLLIIKVIIFASVPATMLPPFPFFFDKQVVLQQEGKREVAEEGMSCHNSDTKVMALKQVAVT